jgi:hypothetical protein
MRSFLKSLRSMFGCQHNEMSRVFTIERRTYQVCYACGDEFGYSWSRMRRVRSSRLENWKRNSLQTIPEAA